MDYNTKKELEANSYTCDTSFLHSLFVKNDTNHSVAVDIFLKINSDAKYIIPYIVVAELLMAEVEKGQFIEACKNLASSFMENVTSDLQFIQTLPIATRKSLKANDCLILGINKRTKSTLLTFDKKLYKKSQI